MFSKVNVPVLGIVENMAYFVPDDAPEKKYYIFGKHGARKLAQKLEVPFLGEVPLREQIRETSDSGTPVVAKDPASPAAIGLKEIANRIQQTVSLQNKNGSGGEKVDIKIRP
jgi:ATP-binding protein involved in chromosome partitioning